MTDKSNPSKLPHEETPELEVSFKSVAIQRLIEEVRIQNETSQPNAYNRVYHRHNR